MLSDEQKKNIEAEEIHRYTFRKTLEDASAAVSKTAGDVAVKVEGEKTKLSSQLMAFLNSSVGTLLISSVVITCGA